jgi:hypothetical protein
MNQQLKSHLAIFIITFVAVILALQVDRYFISGSFINSKVNFNSEDREYGQEKPSPMSAGSQMTNYIENSWTAEFSKSCKSDLEKVCGELQSPDQGARCLYDSHEKLSKSCQKIILVKKTALAPCQNDIAKFCKGKNVLSEGVENCLKENLGGLSPACSPLINHL